MSIYIYIYILAQGKDYDVKIENKWNTFTLISNDLQSENKIVGRFTIRK